MNLNVAASRHDSPAQGARRDEIAVLQPDSEPVVVARLAVVFHPNAEAQPLARRSPEGERVAVPDGTDLRGLERTAIERAMQDVRYNKSKAAKLLGLSRKQLYVRLRQHGLE